MYVQYYIYVCFMHEQILLTNLSTVNPTLLNGKPVKSTSKISHKDLLTIIDRSFRFEFPPNSVYRTSNTPAKSPGKILSPKYSPAVSVTPKASRNETPKSKKSPTPKRIPLSPKAQVGNPIGIYEILKYDCIPVISLLLCIRAIYIFTCSGFQFL